MKKLHIIVFILAGIIISIFLLWPAATLKLAKLKAIRKFSQNDAIVLNCIPSSSVLSIPHFNLSADYSFAKPSGCEVGLPNSEFQQDPVHPIVFTNNNWIVACFGTLDKTNFNVLEQETGRTNVFNFISGAYQATVKGISDQQNMRELQQYLTLLLYKATTAPVGFDSLWSRFDRGDFSGFISGDLSKSDRVAVEIYLKQKDEFLTLLIRRQKGHAGDMPDVYHILSELMVKPNM